MPICFNRRRGVWVLVPLVSLLGAGCALEKTSDREAPRKVPSSTSSRQALELFEQGRALQDRLRGAEARTYFEQAVAADPRFAMGHLALANTAPSAQEFFDSMSRAVELAGEVSEGERLIILGQDAGVRSDPAAQRDYFTRLVEAYPDDERAHVLLGGYHFGRQEYDSAIEHYTRATEIAPEFSPPYNMLGYAYRAERRFDEAETAFKRYVELIPDEPNPYDSYAELLMKTGRFEESIANYRKALEINPGFVFSYVGIGNNQVFLGREDEARATFDALYQNARNDAERRTAFFWQAISYVHEGKYEDAERFWQQMRDIAAAKDDKAAIAGDYVLLGNIQLYFGSLASARTSFEQALQTMEKAEVNDDVKGAMRRNHLYRLARLDLESGNLEGAKEKIEAYARAVAERNIPAEVRLLHELEGRAALARKEYDEALYHLEQANQQDPRVLYLVANTLQAKGDATAAREWAERAANFNQLSANFAFTRSRARQLLADL